jgi:hypothetical protein
VGTLALDAAYAYVGSHDFSGDINEWRLSGEAATPECTNFRSGGWREYKMGAKTSAFSMSGHYQAAAADAVDPHVFDNLGVASQVITTGAEETEATPAFFHRGMQADVSLFGSYGEVAPFSVNASGDDGPTGVVRGQLAVKMTTVTTTGAKGTALNLGLVAAGKYLYATLHLLGTAGSSITVLVESDEDSGFASATTRITFGPLTTVGGNWGTRVAGAIALDDWFRINVSAITGTWVIASAIGIGS